MEQGALSRPRRTDDGDQVALVDAQVHAGQGHDRGVPGVLLHHVDQLEDRHHCMRLGRKREGRVRENHTHDDGTSTRMPAPIPEPLTWTRLLA